MPEAILKRDFYKNHPKGNVSTLNEPKFGFQSLVDFTKYPDMLACYEKLVPIFGENFIICNGCENALRITLQVLTRLGIKSLSYATPTWGMLDVFCEMFMLEKVVKPFIYDEQKDIIEEPNLSGECYYGCNGINNFFTYKEGVRNCKYSIIDTTYTDIKFNSDDIYIGSLGKKYGCGIRLGYIKFPLHLKELFQLYREQYINSGAEKLILEGKINKEKPSSFYIVKGRSEGKVFSLPTKTNNTVYFTRIGNEYSK